MELFHDNSTKGPGCMGAQECPSFQESVFMEHFYIFLSKSPDSFCTKARSTKYTVMERSR